MTVFFLAFAFLMITVLAMSLGVMLAGKRITGSCGGLNAIAGSDKCLVCKQSIDPDNPLREQLRCPKRKSDANGSKYKEQASVAPIILHSDRRSRR